MARFRYSMQSILDIKLKMETQAKQDFAMEKAKLDAEEEKMNLLLERKREYQEIGEQLLLGKLCLRDIEDNKRAVLCMEDLIELQKRAISAQERAVERAREQLTAIIMERKTHESLKEKAFQQFLEEEKRRESKEVDELTSYTYGQRIRLENSVPG